jgi:hypothetical protein
VPHDRHCPIPWCSSGRWRLSRGTKPLGPNIQRGVDCPGTCETESYMEKLTFTRACLSSVRVIMVIMHVPFIELLCQTTMGWIPALEYKLTGMHGACNHVLSSQTVNTTAS